jgi:hypothetical protein
MPHLRPTRPIVIFKTSRWLRLASVYPIQIFTAETAIGHGCTVPFTPSGTFPRHAKGPAVAERLTLVALGLTLGSDPIHRSGGSGICRVALDFLTTEVFICCSWPTPGPAKRSEPAIIRLDPPNTSGLQPFFAEFWKKLFLNKINQLSKHLSPG